MADVMPPADVGGGEAAESYIPPALDQQMAAQSMRNALVGRAAAAAGPTTVVDAQGNPASRVLPTQPAESFGQTQPIPSLNNLPGTNVPKESMAGRFYHGVLGALGGKFDTQFIPTDEGVIRKQVAKTPGQQWKTIIAGALTGFAGTAAAGTQGPGGAIRGAGAGIQAGMKQGMDVMKEKYQQAHTEFEDQQKAMMTKAQRSLMQIELAKGTFGLGMMQKEAAESDIQRQNQFMQIVHDAEKVGGRMVGYFPNQDAALKAFKDDPTHHDSLAVGRLIANPHVETRTVNGVETPYINGIDVAYMPDDYMSTMTDKDLPVTYKFYENGKMQEKTDVIPKGRLNWGQYFDIQNRLSTMQMGYYKEEIEANIRKQELGIQKAHLTIAQQQSDREAQEFPKKMEEFDARIDALKMKDPYAEAPVGYGTYNAMFPPIGNFARNTPGIDVNEWKKGVDATDKKTEILANNVVANADQIRQLVQDSYPQLSGPAEGRETQLKQWLGTNDPNISKINTFVDNLARANVGIHQMRNYKGIEDAKADIINQWKNGPDAALGALDADTHSANNFLWQIQNRRMYGTATGPDRNMDRGRLMVAPGTTLPAALQPTGDAPEGFSAGAAVAMPAGATPPPVTAPQFTAQPQPGYQGHADWQSPYQVPTPTKPKPTGTNVKAVYNYDDHRWHWGDMDNRKDLGVLE